MDLILLPFSLLNWNFYQNYLDLNKYCENYYDSEFNDQEYDYNNKVHR